MNSGTDFLRAKVDLGIAQVTSDLGWRYGALLRSKAASLVICDQ
jgi:hypothetical protein